MNVRKNLQTRTIFNLLGPLTNPAGAKRQLLGVYDERWVLIHCETLKNLGSTRAMVVHGKDGLDEISLSGITKIAELKNNTITEYEFDPREYGYEYIENKEIKGGDAAFNAKKFTEMLEGTNSSFQKIVEINAGATLYISGITNNLKDGFELAKKTINDQSKLGRHIRNFKRAGTKSCLREEKTGWYLRKILYTFGNLKTITSPTNKGITP